MNETLEPISNSEVARDERILLLLHVLWGLKISPLNLATLASQPMPAQQARDLLGADGDLYFLNRRHWIEESRDYLERSRNRGIEWRHLGDADYPSAWRGLKISPPIFSYRGRPTWNDIPYLAVVGSRTPADETLVWMQRELGQFLANNHNVGIVSGGARGIDQWAHRLALERGRPTVAVLPTGLEKPYPFGYEELWEEILSEGGALVSTYALDEPLRKSAFAVRNRWIAGLANGCFVVEANRRSGSALTAKLAGEEAREVATLPFFPHSQQGLGNLDLLNSGAQLLRDAADLHTFWARVSSRSP